MSGANSFGQHFRITTFGESHGVGLGVVIDGCPAGVEFFYDLLQKELDRRRPGQDQITSTRQEADQFEILSGVWEGKTLGSPIAMLVRNQDARSGDYASRPQRPGHADDLWLKKFGHADHRGGGRASGRETVARVMAGSVAQMLLKQLAPELRVVAFARQIHEIEITSEELSAIKPQLLAEKYFADQFLARFPHQEKSLLVKELLQKGREIGESFGGVVEVFIAGVPAGLGEPVFHKLKSTLGSAFLSIGAVVGVEFGMGFQVAKKRGSEFHGVDDSSVYGGIRGGISTGELISARIVFKPTSSIKSVATSGRHDPCIVPRAIPVVEAMANIVMADQLLWRKLN